MNKDERQKRRKKKNNAAPSAKLQELPNESFLLAVFNQWLRNSSFFFFIIVIYLFYSSFLNYNLRHSNEQRKQQHFVQRHSCRKHTECCETGHVWHTLENIPAFPSVNTRWDPIKLKQCLAPCHPQTKRTTGLKSTRRNCSHGKPIRRNILNSNPLIGGMFKSLL